AGERTGGVDAGRVFIYRGGDPLGDDPAWVITGSAGERLGQSLASAYVDDDPRPDLVIGAPGSDATPTLAGRIVVAFGGSPLGARALTSGSGTTPGGRFGWAVGGAPSYVAGPRRGPHVVRERPAARPGRRPPGERERGRGARSPGRRSAHDASVRAARGVGGRGVWLRGLARGGHARGHRRPRVPGRSARVREER